MLRVNTSKLGSDYLKGFAGSVYDGKAGRFCPQKMRRSSPPCWKENGSSAARQAS